MADYENEETQGFKVSDKRRFSPEGEKSQDQDSEIFATIRKHINQTILSRKSQERRNGQRRCLMLISQH